MTVMPNELDQLNQHALQNAMDTDSQLRAKAQPQASQVDVTPNGVTKQIQSLTQKAQANPQDVQGTFQGPSPDMLKMLAISHNYHEVKRATAQQKLVEMSQQARVGFMPDPKQMQKFMKQAGMKVDTSPEGIATATNYFKQYYGENDPVTGASRGEMPKEIQGMMEKAQAGSISKRDLTQFVMGGMIKNDLRSERYAAYTDIQKAAIERKGTEMIGKFADDSLAPEERAKTLGNLAVLYPTTIGQMAKHWLDYAAATPQERSNQIAIASGMQSPKDILARRDDLVNTATGWGMSPELAMQYGDAASQGKPIPPSVQAAIPKITSTTLAMDMTVLRNLSETGIPGNQLGAVMSAYKMGGLDAISHALPAQTPTQIQQDYQKRMLNLESIRTGIEGSKLIADKQAMAEYRKSLAAKYGIAADGDTAKLMIDMIHTFASIKNPDAGVKALMEQTENALAPILGGQMKREPGFLGREVTSFQANPDLVPDSVTGPQQKGAPKQPDRKPVVKLNKQGEAVAEGVKKTGEVVGEGLQLLHGLPGMP